MILKSRNKENLTEDLSNFNLWLEIRTILLKIVKISPFKRKRSFRKPGEKHISHEPSHSREV